MKDYIVKPVNHIEEKVLQQMPPHFLIDGMHKNPDAILVRSKALHDYPLNPELKFIGRAGSGVNNIPLEKCSENGIVVCNAPGANANGVKELVALAMIMASRNIVEALQWTKNIPDNANIKTEVEAGKKVFVGPELYGKKVAVIGLGEIGALVANMCIDFGMQVYGYDPFLTVQHAWGLSSKIEYCNSLEYLFKQCDFITLHVPLNDNTRNIVNQNLLQVAKPGLCLINLARDGLVDNDALREAIRQNIISHYVVDFPDQKTLNMPRTINIPHLGASTPESEYNAAKMVSNQMIDYLVNGNITNSVNFPDLDFGVCLTEQRIAVLHRNIPQMLSQMTNLLAAEHINIAKLGNQHKNGWAYTIFDVDHKIPDHIIQAITNIDGVVKVRRISKQS